MNWKRIRKDAGEITPSDLHLYTSWEFCLDEEGVEGQTECTMRPFKHPDSQLSLGDFCQVACEFTFPNLTEHVGWIQLGCLEFGAEFESPNDFEPEIFLEPDAAVKINDIGQFDLLTRCEGAIRMSFFFPTKRIVNELTANKLVENAASTLNMKPDSMFPITINPLQSIRDWGKLQLTEFYQMES